VTVLAMRGDGLGVFSVFFDVSEQPTKRILIIIVFLAFGDDLFGAEDKLVTAFFGPGEVFLCQKMLAVVVFVLDLLFLLLGRYCPSGHELYP